MFWTRLSSCSLERKKSKNNTHYPLPRCQGFDKRPDSLRFLCDILLLSSEWMSNICIFEIFNDTLSFFMQYSLFVQLYQGRGGRSWKFGQLVFGFIQPASEKKSDLFVLSYFPFLSRLGGWRIRQMLRVLLSPPSFTPHTPITRQQSTGDSRKSVAN